MTATELLDTLEARALLPNEMLANLRQQVSRSVKIVTPESVAKLLVGKGLITAFQAEQLLAVAKPPAIDPDDEMSLAPLDDERGPKSTSTAATAPAKSAIAAPAAAKPVPAKAAPAKPATAEKAAPAAPALPKPAPKAKPAAAKPSAEKKAAAHADPFGLSATSNSLDDLLGSPLADDALLGDPLLGDPLGGNLLGATSPRSEPATGKPVALRAAGRRKKSIPTWVWFALSSAVGLALLAVAIIVLTRSSGDAEWQLAEKDYQAGQDQDATQKLNAFLEAFPQHREASLARLYLGMARLRQGFAAKTDFEGQLTAARRILPELVVEPDFPQVRETLAKMLPDMAAGLAQQAQAFRGSFEQRHDKAELARQGLALADDWRFVPDKLKPWAALQTTSDQVARLSREIDRGLGVEQAVVAIRAAVGAGNGTVAFGVRDRLLQSYPELREGAELDPVIQELLHATPQLVKIDSRQRAAETKPRETPILASFTDVPCATFQNSAVGTSSDKSQPAHLPVADPKSPSVAIRADGAVYWLQANNGAPLGRQFVGFDSVSPVAVPPANNPDKSAGATDWVVFDAVHNELACYGNGATELRWRQAIGESLDSPPLLLGRKLYIALRSGRLAAIDADSGEWLAEAQFPEPLRAAPGVSADGKSLLVAGDHGTLYFVSPGDLRCTAAVYLGYGSGSVRLPPIAIGAYAVVVESPDWDTSALRVVSMPAADAPPRAAQRIALQGQVTASPIIVGNQLILATDRGVALAFDASGSESLPLIKSMRITATPVEAIRAEAAPGLSLADPRQPWFVAVAGNQLWLGGDGLAHGELVASAGAIRLPIDHLVGNQLQQSPIVQGDRIIVLYRRSIAQGVWATAINGSGQPEWQAALASPPVGEPMLAADGAALRLVHPPAEAVVVDSVDEPHGSHISAAPFANAMLHSRGDGNISGPGAATGDWSNSPHLVLGSWSGDAGAAILPGGILAAAFDDGSTDDRSNRLFFSAAAQPEFRASPWSDAVCSSPVALGKGLLIANRVGQLCLIDVATGQSLAAAFQPRLVPDEHRLWQRPASVPGKPEAIVADGGTHLYRLGIDEKPAAHLAALAEATVARPVASDVDVNGDVAFFANDADVLTAVNVADLKPVKAWSLGGRIAFGPIAVGDLELIATGRELLAIDRRLEIAWRAPLAAGAPVGRPLELHDELLFAAATGIIARVARKTGQSRGKIDLEQPLAAGPIACGKNLAVVAQDGSVLIVPQAAPRFPN